MAHGNNLLDSTPIPGCLPFLGSFAHSPTRVSFISQIRYLLGSLIRVHSGRAQSELWCIDTMGDRIAMIMNGPQLHATMQVDHTHVIQSE